MEDTRQLLKIAQVLPIAKDVRLFRFVSGEKGTPLAPFLPGQYLSLFYQIGKTTTSRPYSIASSPKEAAQGYYDIYIHGGGPFTSPWVFENLTEGALVQAGLPEGFFCHDAAHDTDKVIGISGGMSITPLLSMAKAVADGTLDIDLTLFCNWDTPQECLCHEELLALAQKTPNLHYECFVADGALPGSQPGYVSLAKLLQVVEPADATFFVCGPPEMYSALEKELAPLHIPATRWHPELPGEVKSPVGLPGYSGNPDAVWQLTVEIEGRRHTVPAAAAETLLLAMERAGLALATRCRSGACGYCLSSLLYGSIYVPAHWDTRSEEEYRQNKIHPCCTFPLSDVEMSVPG